MAAVLLGLRVAVAAIAGLVLMLGAVLFGAVLGSVALLWKLLSGRRGRAAPFGGRAARPASQPRATRSDVIDVEVREVSVERRPMR